MKELIEEALEEGGVEGDRRNIYRILKENTGSKKVKNIVREKRTAIM